MDGSRDENEKIGADANPGKSLANMFAKKNSAWLRAGVAHLLIGDRIGQAIFIKIRKRMYGTRGSRKLSDSTRGIMPQDGGGARTAAASANDSNYSFPNKGKSRG